MLGSRKAAWRSAFGRTRAAVGRLHRCERGQAIYVVALFFFLLAGLLFLIVNSGEKLNHKVEMQSAADSAAATGAAWFARGLNVISMCNVAETQLLSLIVLCDTLETVTPPDIADKCGADFGFLLPLNPVLPVRDGRWTDFENPMRIGRMPPPDDRKEIGGFAHVMNYRGYYPDYLYKGEIQHGRGPVMGPWSYWREPFTATRPMGMLDISRFSVLFNLVSSRKLEMLFGMPDPQVSLRNWEMKYDQAKGMGDNQILRSWWETVSFSCRYPYPESEFFANSDLRHHHRPTIRTYAYEDWYDAVSASRAPRSGKPPMAGVEQGASVPVGWQRSTEACEGADPREAVWYAVTKHWSYHFPQLGIFASHPPMHTDGSKWEYTDSSDWRVYYKVRMYRFDGAEIATDETLHRGS